MMWNLAIQLLKTYLLYRNPKKSLPQKLVRVVAYQEGLLPIKPHGPLIIWFCKIISQTRTIISQLPQCLWPPNLTEWWVILRGPFPGHMDLKLLGPARSRDKLKTSPLPQCLRLPTLTGWWRAMKSCDHKVIWSFTHVFLLDQATY